MLPPIGPDLELVDDDVLRDVNFLVFERVGRLELVSMMFMFLLKEMMTYEYNANSAYYAPFGKHQELITGSDLTQLEHRR